MFLFIKPLLIVSFNYFFVFGLKDDNAETDENEPTEEKDVEEERSLFSLFSLPLFLPSWEQQQSSGS